MEATNKAAMRVVFAEFDWINPYPFIVFTKFNEKTTN